MLRPSPGRLGVFFGVTTSTFTPRASSMGTEGPPSMNIRAGDWNHGKITLLGVWVRLLGAELQSPIESRRYVCRIHFEKLHPVFFSKRHLEKFHESEVVHY